ncbi:MAG: hypothetical protein V1921_04635 [Candidatus Altiarchaeota archaeon]
MSGKFFRNQTSEEIIKHLAHFLGCDSKYDLFIDPLGVYFRIVESHRTGGGPSHKRELMRQRREGMTRGERKRIGSRKMTRPKIRSVKKYRTVNLKGRDY